MRVYTKECGNVGNIEIGVVIHERIKWYLCFTYIPVSTVSLVFSEASERE